MSFSRASLKRFNEVHGCAPPVGYYDPRGLKVGAGPAFEKSERFNNEREFGPSPADFDISSCSMVNGVSMLGNPQTTGVYSSTPRKKSISSASSIESLKEKKMKTPEEAFLSNRVRELEREIKKLLQEKTDLNKQLTQREDEMKKLEGRLQHAQSDRTALFAKVASLEKDIKDVNKSNSVLKNKVSTTEVMTKKRDDKLHTEMSEVRKQLEKKDKEISGIKRDMEEAVSGLLHDLGEVSSVTDKLNCKVSKLEQSFDDKDVDSTETAKEKKYKSDEKHNLDVTEKVRKARSETQKIKSSLQELSSTTERKIQNVKSKLREKYEGTVAKIQLLSEELKMKEENLESSKTCAEALKKYGDALKSQNRGLMLILSHLRQEQWQCEDTIRSLKGEMFALSDENKVYEQQTFESNAEVATLMEKIEQLEEKEDMLNTNIKNLTEKYQILEQNLGEDQKHHKSEYEKLVLELQVTQRGLHDTKSECEASQKTNKNLIQSLNATHNDSEKLMCELDKSKSVTEELRSLAESRAKELAEKDALLHQTQDRIDILSQEIALKSSQINSLQTRLSESEGSESGSRSQLSELTVSHKKTVEVYLQRIEKLEEEKSCLLEKKHSLLSEIDKLVAEKVQLASNLQSTEELLGEMRLQHESDIKERQETITLLEGRYHQTEREFCEKLEQLEHQLKSVTIKSESDIDAREQSMSELETTLSQVQVEREETRAQLTSCKENLTMVTEELNAAMEDVAKLSAEKETVIQRYEERLVSLREGGEEERKHWEKVQQELNDRLQDSQQQTVTVQEKLSRLESESSSLETELSDRLKQLKTQLEQDRAAWESEEQTFCDKLKAEERLRGQAEEDLVRHETEKEMEQQELRDKLLNVRNELTQAESNLKTTRTNLTSQLEASQDSHRSAQEKLASLKETMLVKERELRGHLVEAEREVSRLRDLKNNQADTIEQLKKEKAAVTEERNRLREEKNFDTACTSERYAVLEENARVQRKLFEELKEDYTSKLAEARADKASVTEEFDLYKKRVEMDVNTLKVELRQSEEAQVRGEELKQQMELLHTEKTSLAGQLESMKLSSIQTLGDVQSRLVTAENEVAELLTIKLEQEQIVARLRKEKTLLNDERNRCVSEYNSLAKEMEELREEYHKQLKEQAEATSEYNSLAKEIEELREEHHNQIEEQAESADTDALLEEMHKWRTLYEELQEKVAPFIEQIDAFEAERLCLLGRSAHAQAEINKLSMDYAKLLGHQNQKQKIRHIVKLKEENNSLKKETAQLREQVMKLKRQMERAGCGDKLNPTQTSRKKFDPSRAFHHSKENRMPGMSPLRDGNRR